MCLFCQTPVWTVSLIQVSVDCIIWFPSVFVLQHVVICNLRFGCGDMEGHDRTISSQHERNPQDNHHQNFVSVNFCHFWNFWCQNLFRLWRVSQRELNDLDFISSCRLWCSGHGICVWFQIRERTRPAGTIVHRPSVLLCRDDFVQHSNLHFRPLQISLSLVTGSGGPMIGMFYAGFFFPCVNAIVSSALENCTRTEGFCCIALLKDQRDSPLPLRTNAKCKYGLKRTTARIVGDIAQAGVQQLEESSQRKRTYHFREPASPLSWAWA